MLTITKEQLSEVMCKHSGRKLGHRPNGQDRDGQGVLSAGNPEITGGCYTLSRWFSVKRRLSNPWKGPVSLDDKNKNVTLNVL